MLFNADPRLICQRYADREVNRRSPTDVKQLTALIKRRNRLQRQLRRIEDATYDATLKGRDLHFLWRRRDQLLDEHARIVEYIDYVQERIGEVWSAAYSECVRPRVVR